jgi:putative endonuclease
MAFYTYILYSEKLNKYYSGSTEDLEKRLKYHNMGQVKFTSTGIPWNLIWSQSFITRAEAIQIENKIKKRGAKRYLIDLGTVKPG